MSTGELHLNLTDGYFVSACFTCFPSSISLLLCRFCTGSLSLTSRVRQPREHQEYRQTSSR